MPIWLAIIAHFLLPNERLTPLRLLGLILAILGVILAFLDRSNEGSSSLTGDIMALVAAFWLGRVLRYVHGLLGSAKNLPKRLVRAALILWSCFALYRLLPGPLVREIGASQGLGLLFQIFVASYGFLLWFKLIGIYEASSVASFSFLAPVLSVGLGWLILSEQAGLNLLFALICVALGLILINRK